MAFPHNHKTIIVLDRSPPFLKSSDQTVDFDVFSKQRTPGIIPMAPLAKSLWTCNIEACMEFCRVVYDIYPGTKLIRVVVGDRSAKSLNSWEQPQQNIQHLMTTLAQTPMGTSEDTNRDIHIIGGLTEAVKALCEPTPVQTKLLQESTESSLLNKGRIICLTHLRSESHLSTLEDCLNELIQETNKLAQNREELIEVDGCEVMFLHIVPVGHYSTVPARNRRHISSVLTSELRVTQSGRFVANKMLELCTQGYSLCSTTVTGIPMKEEQNASSSANYDVELLHPGDAHDELFISGCADGLVIPSKEGLYTSTVTLKWVTPKTNLVELHQCTGAYRFTPVDNNSRPSSCLTNFLLNGRSVMLEQPKKIGTRVVSHMLTSHGGELFIHVLATTRCTLEDPPSISEGSGGRVTDYRIKDFAELMRESKLAPMVADATSESAPIQKALNQLERLTRVWPMTISETIIFNMMSHLDPLPSLILKKTLSNDEVLECKKAIYHVVGMENRNDPLPSQQSGKVKSSKRDEQYRQVWNELEQLVRAHSDTSPQHKTILECLIECRKPDETRPPDQKKQNEKDEKPNPRVLDVALKEFDRYQSMTEREKQEFNKADTPLSPPLKRVKTENIFPKGKGQTNLLALWTGVKTAYLNSRCNEFTGRTEFGTKAQLYKKFHEEKNKASNEPAPSIKTEKVKPEKLKGK